MNVGGGVKCRNPLLVIGYNAAAPAYEVRLNTCVCQPNQENFDYQLPKDIGNVHTYSLPPGALHDGDNVVEFMPRKGETASITWLEVLLR